MLTTTTPLVSGWFHAASDDGPDPYWLYALSNAGSLLALLAYPLLIEPRLGLGNQRGVWAIGYAVLVGLLGWAAFRAMPGILARPGGYFRRLELIGAEAKAGAVEIDWPRRFRWLLLAAIPSGLLSAVTNFIATDLVSAPLLWVIPLAIYLVSFVIAFSQRGAVIVRVAIVAAPAMVTLLWIPYGSAGGWPILALLVTELVAFALVAIALHGRLALDRPGPGSPHRVLPDRLDRWRAGLGLRGRDRADALPGHLGVPDPARRRARRPGAARRTAEGSRPGRSAACSSVPSSPAFPGRLLPFLVGGGLLAALLFVTDSLAAEAGIRWLIVGGLILLFGGRPWFLVLTTAVVLTLATLVLQPSVEFRSRSFFGVTEVIGQSADGTTVLMNGTTVHGTQFDDPARRDTRRPITGGTARPATSSRSARRARPVSPKAIGIVGLGAGHARGVQGRLDDHDLLRDRSGGHPGRPGSQATSRSCRTPRAAPDIVEGDARLSLATQPDGRFDLLVMDAFSSDSVPVHLLTVEAITDEVRTLARTASSRSTSPTATTTSRRPIAAALGQLGFVTLRARRQRQAARARSPVAGWRPRAAARRIAAFRARGWHDPIPASHPFTDDYADLLSYLRLGP